MNKLIKSLALVTVLTAVGLAPTHAQLVANGTFTANASSFKSTYGLCGFSGNPSGLTSWNAWFQYGGSQYWGVEGPVNGLRTFLPSGAASSETFAIIQPGGTATTIGELWAPLTATPANGTTYQIQFDVGSPASIIYDVFLQNSTSGTKYTYVDLGQDSGLPATTAGTVQTITSYFTSTGQGAMSIYMQNKSGYGLGYLCFGNVSVTAATLPAPIVGNSAPACAGTLSLTASPPISTLVGVTWSWTGPNGFTSTAQNPTVASSATPANSGTYTCTMIVNSYSGASYQVTSSAATTVTINDTTPPPAPPSNILANGDFTGNASSFVAFPGYIGGSNPSSITGWTIGGSSPGLNGAACGSGTGTPFAPANLASQLTYAFMQDANTTPGAGLRQSLPSLAANTQYELVYSAAGRNGNTGTAWRVAVYSDSSYGTAWYDSGVVAGNTSTFVTNYVTFTTPSSLSGSQNIVLYNQSGAGDQTVDFAELYLFPVTFCSGATVANLSATGTSVKWYSAATGGTALSSTTPLVNGTTYYASQTTGACGESSARMPVTVAVSEPPTTATVASSTLNVCELISGSLGGNIPVVGSGSWSLVSGPGTVIFSDPGSGPGCTATVSTYGTYVFAWTISNAGCTPSTANVTVNYYQTPTTASVANSPLNVCGLVSGSLGGNTPSVGSGAWSQVSGPGTVSFSAGTSGSSTATVTAYGTYVFKWTISNGACTPSTANVTVNYYATPTTASVASSPLNVCGLVSGSLGGNTPSVGSGAWSQVSGPGTASFSAGTLGSSTATVTAYGTYVFAWTISNGTCTPSTANVTVNYYATSVGGTATAAASTVCSNNTTTVTVSGYSGTIQWQQSSDGSTGWGNVTGGSGATSATYTTPALTSTTYYRAAVTNGVCSGAYSTTNSVTVNTPSVAPTSATATPSTICSGSSSTLSASGGSAGTGATFHWYSGSCGGTSVGTGTSLSVSPTSTTTYYGRYIDPSPCSDSTACVSVTVTVNTKSVAPTSASASPATICAGSLATLTLSGGGAGTGGTVKWYTGSCGGTLVATGNNASVSPTATTTYYGRYEDGSPCSDVTSCQQVTVTVNTQAVAPTSASASPATICAGSSATLTLSGGGAGTGGTVKWYTGSCGGTLVGTGNNASVSPTATTTYYGRYEDGSPCSDVTSCQQVTVTVSAKSGDPTSASASPATICTGGSATLTLNGGGGGTGETIHWYTGSCGGSAVGAGNSLSVSPTATTTYYGRYEDGTPCNYNSACRSVTVTVNPLPAVSVNSVTINAGGSATLTATTGASSPSYLWNDPSSATTASITVSPGVTTTYTVTVTDGTTSCINSGSGTVTVNPVPVLTMDTTNQVACAGSVVTWSVAANGTGLTYQWQRDGTNLVEGVDNFMGATTATLTNSAVAAQDAQDTNVLVQGYACVISSGTNSVSSTLASLTVNALPTVGVDSQTICAGGSATLTATTSASSPSYQWNDPSSATTASLTVSPAATTTYTVTVTDGMTGCANSGSGTVTINPLPTVSVIDWMICAGGSATLTATTDASSPSYQWNDPSSATTASLTVSPGVTTTYTVTVTDGTTGCSQSGSGTVTVSPLPMVGVNSQTICAGDSVVLTATTGASSPSYQWNDPSSATTATITVSPASTTTYTVTVTDGTTSCINSGSGTVTVNPPPTITTDTTNQVACVGSVVTWSAAATGTGLTYQWQRDGTNLVENVDNFTGTTTATLTNSAVAAADSEDAPQGYACVVTIGTCSVTSTLASLTVNALPGVSVNSPAICAGSSAVLTATTGASSPSYLWNDPSSATTASLTVSPAATTTYTVTVTDGTTGCSQSGSGTVTVNPQPTVGVNSAAVCAGGSATLTATTSASSPSYQWNDPSSATTPSITVSPASTTSYTVTVTDGTTGCANSGSGTVTVNPQPTVGVNSAAVCAGSSAVLTATTSASSPSYLWNDPSSATTASIAVSPAVTTTYTVTVTDGTTSCSQSGSGMVTVTACSETNVVRSIVNNHNGTFTLHLVGTPEAQYYVEYSGGVKNPMAVWTPVVGSTNTAGSDGTWTCVVSNAPAAYYRGKAVNPGP